MKHYYVKPGTKVNLNEWNPNDQGGYEGSKEDAKNDLLSLNGKLEALQELLYAEHKHKLLIILQGMDTSGKDGVIRNVFEGVNPQGVKVASFKVPTSLELDHDYLWRIHQQIPGKGEIVIFNRSHYEDCLVVRVHGLVPVAVWKKRFQQIINFEKMLAEEGVTILKFYLHIDKEEQKQRLQARLDDPTKHWKFNIKDLEERTRWNEYIEAYEDVLSKTSSEYAPWVIVPANRKWYRNIVIASVIVNTLEELKMKYPEPPEGVNDIVIV